jgi:RecA-family ATPase
MTYTPDDAELRGRFKVHSGGLPADMLELVRASDWEGKPVPQRRWLVEDMLPMGTVSALYGDGGGGKSLLLLQLAVAATSGRPWLGRPVRQGPALIIAAEDDADELHRRVARICEHEGIALPANLYIRPAIEDGHLADLDPRKGIVANPFYDRLRATVAHLQPALVGLDTLGPLNPGNENDRAQATAFVGLLKGLAGQCGSSVLLVAHPSLTGMASGSGLSGSTSWNNSVRSRLYLEREAQEGYEPNPDRRVLRTVKANYGPAGAEIGLTWRDGAFVADAPETPLDRMSANAKGERVFLKLLDLFTAQGRRVSPLPSATYAPKLFADHPEREGVTKRALATAMETLLNLGALVIQEDGPPSKRRSFIARAAR